MRSYWCAAGRHYVPSHTYRDICVQPTLRADLQACYKIAQRQPLAISLSKRGSRVGNEKNISKRGEKKVLCLPHPTTSKWEVKGGRV